MTDEIQRIRDIYAQCAVAIHESCEASIAVFESNTALQARVDELEAQLAAVAQEAAEDADSEDAAPTPTLLDAFLAQLRAEELASPAGRWFASLWESLYGNGEDTFPDGAQWPILAIVHARHGGNWELYHTSKWTVRRQRGLCYADDIFHGTTLPSALLAALEWKP
jgi:hypothetical protein